MDSYVQSLRAFQPRLKKSVVNMEKETTGLTRDIQRNFHGKSTGLLLKDNAW